MGTSCLTYTSCKALACSGATPADLILCIPSDKVKAVPCPGGEIENEPFVYSFIYATLTGVKAVQNGCDLAYEHSICFDDTHIADGETLEASDITGVICEGCLTQWMQQLFGDEVSLRDNGDGTYTLITQHGCEYTFSSGTGAGFTVSDTNSLDLNLAGAVLSGNVKISPDAGNSISIHANGIYAPTPTGITVSDTSTVDLTLTGSDLSAAVKVSPDAGNAISAHANGVWSQALSVLDTSSIDLTLSTGTLSGVSKVSPDAGNQLSIHANGLYVPSTSVSVTDTSSIDLTLTGSAISGAVKISNDPDNCLEIRADGLYVPCGGGGGGGGGGGAFSALWAQDGTDKVTQDELRKTQGQDVTSSVYDGSNINLFGAKNEVISFNLVLEAANATVNTVTIQFNDLVDGASNHISSTTATGNGVFNYVGRNIELFVIKYLPIQGLSLLHYDWNYDERHVPIKMQRPYTGAGFANPGTGWVNRPNHDKFYPEIACPIEAIGAFNVTVGTNQQVWCDIYIPKTANTGIYTGNLLVKVNGSTTNTIPVNLEVRDFELPDVPSFKASGYLGSSDLNLRFLGIPYTLSGAQDTTMLPIRREFFKMFHRHKVDLWNDDVNAESTAVPSGQPRNYWHEFLDGTAYGTAAGYDGPGKNTPNWIYMIGAYGSWQWAQTQGAFQTNTNAWYTYMNANYPTVKYPLYLSDESPNYAQTETWAGWVETNPGVGQNIKTLATLSWLNGQSSTPSLTIDGTQFNWGVTSAWNSAHSYWTAGDKEAWLYNGYRILQGSFATDDEGVSPLVSMLACYKKAVDSWFFWAVNYWDDLNNSQVRTHLWTDARTFGYYTSNNTVIGRTGFLYSNGDGVLAYPGSDVIYPSESLGLAGPLASLRLKHLRRGVQNIDYVTLAKAVNSGATNTLVSSQVPSVLWEVPVADPGDPTYGQVDISWSVDPDDWESFREQLADIIEGATPANNTSVKVGTFNLNTATGNQSITGVGFQPKGVLFIGSNVVGNGNAASAVQFIGAASSSTSRWAATTMARDAQVVSSEKRNFTSTKCISAINPATATTLYEADFVTNDADGFTINVTTAPASGYTMYYVCFGGSAVSAKAAKIDVAASTGTQAFTGTGFQPKLLLFANSLANTTEGITADANLTISSTVSTSSQWANSIQAQDLHTPEDPYSNQVTNAALVRFRPGDTPVEGVLTSFDADGFTINVSYATSAPRFGYLGLRADHVKLGSFNQRTSTGAQSITGIGFEPKFILLTTWGKVASGVFSAGPNCRAIGFGTAPTQRGCIAAAMGSSNPTSASSRSRGDKLLSVITNGGASPTVTAECDLTSLDADGFTITWGVADAVAREILYMAIG